jgi:hypothetical protein
MLSPKERGRELEREPCRNRDTTSHGECTGPTGIPNRLFFYSAPNPTLTTLWTHQHTAPWSLNRNNYSSKDQHIGSLSADPCAWATELHPLTASIHCSYAQHLETQHLETLCCSSLLRFWTQTNRKPSSQRILSQWQPHHVQTTDL